MVGKRHSGITDNTIYKMSQVESAPQHSVPYPGKTIPKDVQVCKNFLTYPFSGTEGSQHSFNPWSSTTAYLQYAGNALNQHLQSGGVSKCQRPETERIKNPLQLTENSNSHLSAHRQPVHNYHMSPSRAYPQFAVPRPVYRSPSSFMDPAYQTRDFQSMGVQVGAQTHCPPAMEWSSSTRFPYSSAPLYVSGIKNLHPANNGYLEASGSPNSLSQTVQELGPVQRHRTDINTSVGSSPSYYQEDAFTDHLNPFAQHNMQLLCAESNVSVGKPRNSAFTTPTHEHYKCIPYQGSPDNRIGHMYSKAYYDGAVDRYHQRSLYSCSMDKSVSPLGIKESTSCGKAQKVHSGYVNTEPRAITQFDDRTQMIRAQAELGLQNDSRSRTSRELQMCPGQKDKASLFEPGPMKRDFCVNIATLDKEHVLGSTRVSSDLHERSLYDKCITEQSSYISFLQQNGSKLSPTVPTKRMVANEPVKESSLTSKLSSPPGSLHTLDRRKSNATFDKQVVENHSQAADLAHANATVRNSSGSVYKPQLSNDNLASSHEAHAIESPCSAAQSSEMDADDPKSPPMPVINDVFSLAPYRAYLEGKAPHPFPVHQESEVENNTSTSFSQQPSPSEKAGEDEKDTFKSETIPDAVNNTVCHDTENKQQTVARTEESQDVCLSNNTMDAEIVDLSLKRSTRNTSSMQDQVNMPHGSHKPPPQLVVERNLSQVSEVVSNNSQDSCLSQVTRIMPHFDKEQHISHTTIITSSPSLENCPTQATERTPQLVQERCTTAKTYICQSQNSCPSQAPETWAAQECQRSSETKQSLAHENLAKHNLNANKNLLSAPHKSCSYRAIRSKPLYINGKSKSQFTKNLSQHVEGNSSSQALKKFTLQTGSKCLSRVADGRPDQLFESYQSHTTKHLSIQTAEAQPHIRPKTDTSPLQQNFSQTTETAPHNSFYNCISEPAHKSAQSASLSIFVNAIQTPTTFLPQAIIYSSPTTVFCPKNLNLPSQQHQNLSTEQTERRARKSVDSRRSETSLPECENEGPGFQSSKAFMLHKYKMMKFSNSGPEIQEANDNSASHALPRTFLLPSDATQSLPPSAPESSPTLGEANVSLASADELSPNGSGQQFSELHRLVRAAITSSVARSPFSLLEDWLEKTKDTDRSKTPLKAKSGSRPNDPSPDSPCHDIWQDFDGVRLRLHKLLSQLETFMFTRSCPFPHVIRAGAIFIPIHLVKEVLFPELGTSVDRVLQKHKVELRPTTLSEEKLLRETKLKDCSSRMLKLLALKQLPDVYPDLLHLFCEQNIRYHLDRCSTKKRKSKCQAPDPSKKSKTVSPRKGKASLIIRLQQVFKSSGRCVYRALQPRPLEKSGTETLQTRKVCRKKSYKDRTLITYKRRRRVRSSKGFPDLVGKRILHLFDDGERETWFPGKVLGVHRHFRNPKDNQYEVWYDAEPGTRYFLELLQDYEKGWLKLDS